MSPLIVQIYPDRILFVSIAEKAAVKILETRLRETQPIERARSEDGTLNCAHIVWLTKHLILRSRKRRNSGGSEDPVQDFASGYGFYVPPLVDFSLLTSNHSQDPEERQGENGSEGQSSGQRADR